MAAVFEEPIPEDVEAKRSLMLRHRIALWDVIDNCLISAPPDSSIKDPVPNDIAGLMKKTAYTADLYYGAGLMGYT